MDGCTVGPCQLGDRYHGDICDLHDLDWWYVRTVVGKFAADVKWSYRIVERHIGNGLWIIPAALYAGIGQIWLQTGGWLFWAGLVGKGRRLRK